MKFIFIVNPVSGKSADKQPLIDSINARQGRYDVDVYLTKAPKDATQFVKDYCTEHPDEDVCFVACGGDGTLNEVVNGAAHFANAAVSAFPCGSGNDYIKYYGGKDYFMDIDAILEGTPCHVDVMQIGDRYAINATHFGFDSYVAAKFYEFRHKKNPYMSAVLYALVHGMKNHARILADGEVFFDGDYSMCTVCNGTHVGGSYKCAPRSSNHDGLLELCLFRRISRIGLLTRMKSYERGTHLEDPRIKKYLVYGRAKDVDITVPKGFYISLDGEVIQEEHIVVHNIAGGLRFVVPKGAPIK